MLSWRRHVWRAQVGVKSLACWLWPGFRLLDALTAREIRLSLDGLQRQGHGARTVRYVHSTLRAALEDAMREEIIEKNVAKLVRPPSVPRQERTPLTVDEVREFLRANRDDRLYALYVVIALLGLRRSEVLGLHWSDVDLEHGVLAVRRGLHRVAGELKLMEPKTRRSRRSLPLPGFVGDALAEHAKLQAQELGDVGGLRQRSSSRLR